MISFNFDYLRQQRKQQKMTQSQWGKLLGVTGSTVGNWERADSYPSVQDLINIADITGISDINFYFMKRISE